MDDPPLSEQIAKMQSIGRNLDKQTRDARHEEEKWMANAAYLCGLMEQKKEADREIARMEGRKYRDPDKPDGDWPESPEPPDSIN
jgi:hypothetical protein